MLCGWLILMGASMVASAPYSLSRWVAHWWVIQSMATTRVETHSFLLLCVFFVLLWAHQTVRYWAPDPSAFSAAACCGKLRLLCVQNPLPGITESSRRILLLQCVYPQISVNTTLWILSLRCSWITASRRSAPVCVYPPLRYTCILRA